jgi:hypothetical protein
MPETWNEWRIGADNKPISEDTLRAMLARANGAYPLYIEWARETTTNDRPVEAGIRKVRLADITRVELVLNRDEFVRAPRRDRREGRGDFRFFVTGEVVQYKDPRKGHYLNGYAVPQLAYAK